MNTLKSPSRSPIGLALLASLASLLGAAAAAAPPAADTRSVTVGYSDLNLATLEGASTLYQRLRRAAREVCDSSAAGLAAYHEYRICYRTAMADAVTKVNNPLLTALHRGTSLPPTATAMNR